MVPHANVSVLNAGATIPGGAITIMEEVITMGGEVQIQSMDAAVKTPKTEK